ncbi:MAG: hypothetical protein MZV65_45455 [Chromatiales bacterium]|nr:hypothetical protein [Chromatiales bacterium]
MVEAALEKQGILSQWMSESYRVQKGLRHHHRPGDHLDHPQRQGAGLLGGVPPGPGLPDAQGLDRGADRKPGLRRHHARPLIGSSSPTQIELR